nr:hypothetical protein Iba_scaffold61485CG0130 [Ipomoea batatas]
MPQLGAHLAEKCRNDVRTWPRNAATWCGLGRDMQQVAEVGEKCRNECADLVRTLHTNSATMCGLGREMAQRGADLADTCRNEVRRHGREMPQRGADYARTWPRNAATMCGLVRTVRGHGREMSQRCADLVRTWPRNAATMCGLGADMAEQCRNERFPGNVVRTWCGLGRVMPQRGAGYGREMSQRWARPWPRSAAISAYRGLLAIHPSTFDDDGVLDLCQRRLTSFSCQNAILISCIASNIC